tara:strand:- start:7464 stop:7634 length:171 start_codon:yes stop_codon:yes gene_type:complete
MTATKKTKTAIKPELKSQLENPQKKSELVKMVCGDKYADVHKLEVDNFKAGGFIIK